ncbi:MAG: OsmC family protein [Gemmatimonadaceae bacterium]|nr:OsmC family protein [Gemmatimonadaceae bacterium]
MTAAHEYRTHLTWTGASHGPTTSYDAYSRDYVVAVTGKPLLSGSSDTRFRGDPTRHNPEDLLVAALSSCHLLSYLALAARKGLAVVAYEDDACGTMALRGGRGHFTEAVLRPRVTIAPGGDAALAMALHEQAHRDCFIAASVNFPVRCEPTVLVAERVAVPEAI